MPVNTKHKLFTHWVRDWRLCRAVCSGERAVKSKRMRPHTLPQLSGHVGNSGAYDQYVRQAHFFPGAGRYRDGLAGLLFQVRPSIEAPEGMARFLEDVTGSDSPCQAEEFMRSKVGRELVTTGRAGILTDYPVPAAAGQAGQPRDLTVAEVERRGFLPTWTMYRADAITNWSEEKVGGRRRTTLVVLEEWKTAQDPQDKFLRARVKQWRVLELVAPTEPGDVSALPKEATIEDGGDGRAYHVEIWRLKEGKKESDGPGAFEVVDQRFPRRMGRLLDEIPFEVVNAEHCELGGAEGSDDEEDVTLKPPLLDIVTVNLGHFRNSAMLEHGLLFTGSPQPWITGYEEEEELGYVETEHGDPLLGVEDVPTTRTTSAPTMAGQELERWHLGSSTILLIKNPEARLGMLSAKGSDLSGLREAMDSKQDEMVVVGGRILARDKLGAEAARTEEIRREGERGVVSTIGSNLGSSATRWLQHARDWMGVAGEVKAKVNTDFMAMMDPSDALAVSDLFIRGHIGRVDMNDLFRRGRIVRAERTDKAIADDLRADPPTSIAGGEPLPAPDPVPGGAGGSGA